MAQKEAKEGGDDTLMENRTGLPSEIIQEILSRLPVKSLCRFRCMSKPWNSVISNPNFVKEHSNKAIENEDVFHQRRRLIFTDAAYNSLYSLHLDEFLNHNYAYLNHVDTYHDINIVDDAHTDDDNDLVPTELDYVFSELTSNSVYSMCHCNGLLLCELDKGEMYLVNPATRESKKLENAPKLNDPGQAQDHGHIIYGFGYDHSTDDYKVVSGINYYRDYIIGTWFYVYSLKTSSWRQIEKPSFLLKYFACSPGIFLNGGLHWLMRTVHGHRLRIVSLLLGEEKIEEIPLPWECSINTRWGLAGVFREWLCIIFNVDDRYQEFWVMKEYGVRESWTKLRVSINTPHCDISGFWWKSHDLLVLKERLVMYNFDEESFRKLAILGFHKVGNVGIYIESLVSLRNQPKSSQIEEGTSKQSSKKGAQLIKASPDETAQGLIQNLILARGN